MKTNTESVEAWRLARELARLEADIINMERQTATKLAKMRRRMQKIKELAKETTKN